MATASRRARLQTRILRCVCFGGAGACYGLCRAGAAARSCVMRKSQHSKYAHHPPQVHVLDDDQVGHTPHRKTLQQLRGCHCKGRAPLRIGEHLEEVHHCELPFVGGKADLSCLKVGPMGLGLAWVVGLPSARTAATAQGQGWAVTVTCVTNVATLRSWILGSFCCATVLMHRPQFTTTSKSMVNRKQGQNHLIRLLFVLVVDGLCRPDQQQVFLLSNPFTVLSERMRKKLKVAIPKYNDDVSGPVG